MPEYKDTGRKNTGRTDKYSDEDPLKDYQDYRKDFPKDKETARDTAKKISSGDIPPQHIGPKSLEVKKQELISHVQNMPEFFLNSVVQNLYFAKLEKLMNDLRG